ncbi:MAG: hypothetical protein RR364_01835 [Lachnospiraceae bacterium]
MSIEVNGQVFDSVEDYEENYVVTEMSVEGMRWYEKNQRRRQAKKQEMSTQFTDEETRYYMGAAMKSMFLVLGIFGAGLLGFIAFCVFIWL